MPHYADGSECKVGDQVTGHLANTDGTVAGTVVAITPGAEACNAKVRFTATSPMPGVVVPDYGPIPGAPRMAVGGPVLQRSEAHGQSGAPVLVWTCEDYADTKSLTKVS